MKKSIDFELDYLLFGEIKKFSAFFCMKTSHFMQMLITVGIEDYKNENIKEIFVSKVGEEEKEKLKEYDRKLYQYSDDVKIPVIPDETEDELDELRAKVVKEKNKWIKRCKISLFEETINELDAIYEVFRERNPKLTRSNVISTFLRYEINNRIDYLTDQSIFGINLIEADEAKANKKVNLILPNAFYEVLNIKARDFNVSVDDYIKILVEQIFCEYHQDTVDFLQRMHNKN